MTRYQEDVLDVEYVACVVHGIQDLVQVGAPEELEEVTGQRDSAVGSCHGGRGTSVRKAHRPGELVCGWVQSV